MGWPNNDPEGWDEVCRGAVFNWLGSEIETFIAPEDIPYTLGDVVEMLQQEHRNIFDAILAKVPPQILDTHEADYIGRKMGR